MTPVKRIPAPDDVREALERRRGVAKLTEYEAAMWFFGGVEPNFPADRVPVVTKPDKAPEFEAYRDKAVKDALHALFEGHCAYCESRYDHVAPMDVEHYRPKAEVIEADGTRSKPAYYWLAMNWENLLPSCIGCNRSRTQDHTAADGSATVLTSGKGNLFPLHAGTARAKLCGDERNEVPLLLDPCRDNPTPHLVFRADGLVEPRPTQLEKNHPRGLTTIEVCGLHRSALVENRARAGTRLLEAMDAVLSVDYDCRRHPGDPVYEARRVRKEADLKKVIDDLDYRALTAELHAVFANVRTSLNAYFEARSAWQAAQGDETRRHLMAATRGIAAIHASAGLHQPFIVTLLGLAGIPHDRLLAAT